MKYLSSHFVLLFKSATDQMSTNQSVVSTIPSMVKKVEPRKRKQKGARRDSKAKKAKEEEGKKGEGDKGLSADDKKMLERWENMQKTTKPFIHPIRKHMKDIIDIQCQEITTAQNEKFDAETSDASLKSQVSY